MLSQMARFHSFWRLSSKRIFFIHLSDGHLAIIYNAAMNLGVHIDFGIRVFTFFRHTPRCGVAGSHASSIFNFLRKHYDASTEAAPIYISTNNVGGFRYSPHPHQHLLSFWWCLCTGVQEHRPVVLICIPSLSMMLSIFTCACFHLYASLENSLFRSAHFLN